MAERRMFSKTLMESDSFCELSDKSKLLYLYLNLNADDDSFIGSIRKIFVFTDTDKDNLKELIRTNYIIQFESGVCVIRHWKAHNYLRQDRYHPTLFQEEKAQLSYDESTRTYNLVSSWYTNGIQSGRQMVDSDKTSIDKNSLDKTSLAERSEAREIANFKIGANIAFDEAI